MTLDVYAALDLHQNTIHEFAMDSGAAFPAAPVLGQHWILTPTNVEYYWNGTAWASLVQGTSKFAATIGDGVALSYVVTHNLGTLDTIESVYLIGSGQEELAVIQHTTLNSTTFIFTLPPLLNSVRVVIHG